MDCVSHSAGCGTCIGGNNSIELCDTRMVKKLNNVRHIDHYRAVKQLNRLIQQEFEIERTWNYAYQQMQKIPVDLPAVDVLKATYHLVIFELLDRGIAPSTLTDILNSAMDIHQPRK